MHRLMTTPTIMEKLANPMNRSDFFTKQK